MFKSLIVMSNVKSTILLCQMFKSLKVMVHNIVMSNV